MSGVTWLSSRDSAFGGSDVGRNAADFVCLRESLDAVPAALAIARDAGRLVRQNLILSIAYNAIAVPVAVLGGVTPLPRR